MEYSIKIFISLLLSFQSSLAFAKEMNFNINNSSFSLKFGDSWRATEGLFGMPLVLSGPIENKSRPIISVTPTPFKDALFDDEALKSDQENYERERKAWVTSKKGAALNFDPLAKVALSNSAGYRVGHSYKINEQKFSEASYYLICDKQLFHLKYLVKDEQTKHVSDIQKIIRSFECR